MELATLQDYLHLCFCAPASQHKLSRLLKRYGGLHSICENLAPQPIDSSPDELTRALVLRGSACQVCQKLQEKSLAWSQNPANTILCYEDDEYPPLLAEIDDPPSLLFVQGSLALLSQPQIGIVGSRRASSYGLRNASWLSQELAGLRLAVTSGMAAGIDSRAHEGALAVGGETIAVVGTGVDLCYPKRNNRLREKIIEKGVLVSEFPLGSPPLGFHFPQRNRIISGLSLGIVVVEAAIKSGSLISARLAMEQNREVFAVPGQITNPLAEGCHRLINEGVKLVQSVEDILLEFDGWHQSLVDKQNPEYEPSNEAQALVIAALRAAPASLDFLLDQIQLEQTEVIMALSALEGSDMVKFNQGRYSYCRR